MQHSKYRSSLAVVLAAAALTIGCGKELKSGNPGAAAEMQAVSNAPTLDRQIIKRGQITVRTTDPVAAERKARALVASLGGFVEASRMGDRDAQVQQVTLTARVPVARFDQTMVDFGAFGKRLSSSETAEDVTLQLVDVDARLKTMQAEEQSLREMMRSARSVDASLRIHERLSKLRGDIESMDGQRKALGRQAAMSTIELELVSDRRAAAAGNPEWTKDAWAGASASSRELIELVGTLGIYALVFWPLWVVPLGLIALGMWNSSRRKKSTVS